MLPCNTRPAVTLTTRSTYSSFLVSVGRTLWLSSGHLPSKMSHWVRDTTPQESWAVSASIPATFPSVPDPNRSSNIALMSCHDIGSMSSSCRKLRSLRALTVKAQSPLLPANASVWNKHPGSAERTKLCPGSLVIKKKRSDMSLGAFFIVIRKFKMKSKKAASVEPLNRGDMIWCSKWER